jgi:hypothetical protein
MDFFTTDISYEVGQIRERLGQILELDNSKPRYVWA